MGIALGIRDSFLLQIRYEIDFSCSPLFRMGSFSRKTTPHYTFLTSDIFLHKLMLICYPGVNFVFSGHIHAHERFTAMYNGTANIKGTTYMTIGTGGAGPDTGGFNPFTCASPAPTSGGQATCTASKTYTQNGANPVACVARTTVGVAVANEDDCCSDVPASLTGKCWPKGTQGAFVASTNTNGILPSAATNWFPFLPTTT